VRATIQWSEESAGHRRAKAGKNNNAPKEALEQFYKLESVELPPYGDSDEPRVVGVLRPSDFFSASDTAAAELLLKFRDLIGTTEAFTRTDFEKASGEIGPKKITKATATRYLNHAVKVGDLEKVGNGKDTRYRFVVQEQPPTAAELDF
jgi:hypothetical protein